MDPTSNNMVMPVMPMGGGYGYGMPYGGGWGGGLLGNNNDILGILFIIALCGGGWGFGGLGGWGGGLGMMGGMFGMDMLYPWLNNSQNINDGFRDQQISTQINGIQNAITSGFGDVQLGIAGVNQNICQTGNGIVNAVNSGFANAETAANARQTANLQSLFGIQSAIQNGTAINAANAADIKYTVATEACNDRAAVTGALQNVTMQNTANTQVVLDAIRGINDKLCDQELQAERRENANLRSELMYARGQASRIEQTAQIKAGQAAEVDALYNRLKNCPVGTYSVCNPTSASGSCSSCGGVAMY